MKLTTSLRTLAFAALLVLCADAAEKNGLIASVGKKTIDRDSSTGYYVKTDKTQGLALDLKNNSIKEFPEGEVAWTIVVRRSYEERMEKMSGKEKLKGLKPSQQAQIVLGAAQVSDYKTGYSNYKDKMEYDVIITHDGKETIRLTSTPGFAALAKRAVTVRTADEEEPTVRPRTVPVEPVTPRKEDGGKTAIVPSGGDKPNPNGGGTKPTPSSPVKPAPAAPTSKPTPKGEGEKPAPAKEGDKPAEEEKPFDFFNLDKKKKPEPAEK